MCRLQLNMTIELRAHTYRAIRAVYMTPDAQAGVTNPEDPATENVEVQLSGGAACVYYEPANNTCYPTCLDGVQCGGGGAKCTQKTCGGSVLPIFSHVPVATYAGTCGPAGAGSLFTTPAVNDDDDGANKRRNAYAYCFAADGTPIEVTAKGVSVHDVARSLGVAMSGEDAAASSSGSDDDGMLVMGTVSILSWSTATPSPSAFDIPSYCTCN
jgi:hypothetical protein